MPSISRGAATILIMVTVALGLSIFAAWYRYQTGDDALRFWGADIALKIRRAPTVELLAIEPAVDEAEGAALVIVDQPYRITKKVDLSKAPGLIHARHALLEDASLDLDAPPPASTPNWTRLLRFTDQKGDAAQIAVDPETGWLCRITDGGQIKLKEPQRSLAAYVRKHLPAEAAPEDSSETEKAEL